MSDLFIGLMSGTSLDGVDGVLADFSGPAARAVAHAAEPFDPGLRAELLELNRPGAHELHRAALAANALARCYGRVVAALLARSGLTPAQVRAIGAHGQTVRHCPGEFDGTGYTIQINQPALLAELTGIAVVSDFRARDVAAGGQGAPLAPAFHRALFDANGADLAVLNVGGISNLSVLRVDGEVRGFDCGPGNVLLDLWCQRHLGTGYDEGGHWAAGGQVDQPLLARLLAEPYFKRLPPKSTGRDLFDAGWLDARLAAGPAVAPRDVQATLLELSATAIAHDFQAHARGIGRLIVCGGGALNTALVRRLTCLLGGVDVRTSDQQGVHPLQVEAFGFAWLARQCLLGQPGNAPGATGSRGPRILGAITPA